MNDVYCVSVLIALLCSENRGGASMGSQGQGQVSSIASTIMQGLFRCL